MYNAYSKIIQYVALPFVGLMTESRFWQYYTDIKKSQTKAAGVESEILDKAQALLRHAYEHVPFYKEACDKIEFDAFANFSLDDFAQLPVLSKSDITNNFPDRITSSVKHFEPWRYVSTSGTIERLTVVQDFRKRDYSRAAQLLSLFFAAGYSPGMKYLEMPPDVCRNICGAENTMDPPVLNFFWDSFVNGKLSNREVRSDLKGLIERQLLYRNVLLPSFNAEGLNQKPETLDGYIDSIHQYRPFVMKTLPVYAYTLARHLKKSGKSSPDIKGGIMPMGASMTPLMKKEIESAFECEVYEDYGTSELGGVGAQKQGSTGLTPFHSLFFVEILKDGRPAKEGELGKLVITDFYNYAMPLIRYEIGDVAVVKKRRAHNPAVIETFEVKGRLKNCIVDQHEKVHAPDDISDMLFGLPGVFAAQIEQKALNQFELNVMGENPDINITKIHDFCLEMLGGKAKISIRKVKSIFPEMGGKFRFSKNQMNVDAFLTKAGLC